MANFIIKGDDDQIAAQLKAKLDANDAQFDAQLNAIFGSAPAPKSPPKSPPKPAAIAPATATDGWGDTTSRKKPDGGALRSRLRV